MSDGWPWLVLFLLGAYHGINPGMGWLFAVALGLQSKSRRAVLAALPPIALGHLISIGAIVALVQLAWARVPARPLRFSAAALLCGFGFYRLIRSRHPRWVGMQVGFADLSLWSFLMASAHGAGLMLLPVLLRWSPAGQTGHEHHAQGLLSSGPTNSWAGPQWALAAVGVHTLGYLLVMALAAVVVYEKLGLALLRQAWFNLDLLWAAALLAAGVLTLLI